MEVRLFAWLLQMCRAGQIRSPAKGFFLARVFFGQSEMG
jgi:hypothetical protein